MFYTLNRYGLQLSMLCFVHVLYAEPLRTSAKQARVKTLQDHIVVPTTNVQKLLNSVLGS